MSVQQDAETVSEGLSAYWNQPSEWHDALARLVAKAERCVQADAEVARLRAWGRQASETLDAIGAYMSSLSDPNPASAQCEDLTTRFAALAKSGEQERER